MKSTFLFWACFCLLTLQTAAQGQFKALLVTKTAGWHHESIHAGVTAIEHLAARNAFSLVWHQAGVSLTPKYLEQFHVLIFLNTTGDILTEVEQQAVEGFIRSGKGFVGIHSASDTEYNWPWYTKLVGRMFHIHPAIQTAKLRFTENSFPGLEGFTDGQWWTDEWYEFGPELVPDLQYILAVDESTYNPVADWADKKIKGTGMGVYHPIAWFHQYDGGRSFYTALGHVPAVYDELAFQKHLYAGIFWAATGKK